MVWIQSIGIVVVIFVGIGLLLHILERITKPMEDIKEKLDEILSRMKE